MRSKAGDGDVECGRVYWITGLSGSGKSTLCSLLVDELRERGHSVIMLDGDVLREVMDMQRGHGRDVRLALAMRYSRLCRLLSSQGVDVAIATISMFREVHVWNRENIPRYVEIYLKVPLTELERRDPKGIYRRAEAGELTDVAGIDLAVDEPQNPDVEVDYAPGAEPRDILSTVMARLKSNGVNI